MADFQICISVPLKWNSLILKEHGYYFFQSTFVYTNILAEKIEIGKNLISKSEILLFFHRFCEKEYPFKQNNESVIIYISFYLLKCTKTNLQCIYNLLFSPFPNIRKIKVNYFSFFMSSCTSKQATNKPEPAMFLFSNIFWNICFELFSMQNALSKVLELL